MNQKQSASNIIGKLIPIGIIIICVFLIARACTSTSSSKKNNVCPVCHRTYTNNDDLHSIALRNMCEKCYNNYKYTQNMKEEYKKGKERGYY